jgi:hypothetical protein
MVFRNYSSSHTSGSFHEEEEERKEDFAYISTLLAILLTAILLHLLRVQPLLSLTVCF